MQPSYQIRLRNPAGAYVAIFVGADRGATLGGLRSFAYQRWLRTSGGYTLYIDGVDDRIPLFEDDGIVEFWRRDSVGGLDWYRDFTAFHRSDEWRQGKEGDDIYISRGRGCNDLLLAEAIAWPAGSAEADKTGAAETVAKEFVDENIGPGALAAGGRWRDGAFANLTVQIDAGSGAAWTGGRTNQNLMDVLQELAQFGPGDYQLVETGVPGTPTVAFEFQWRDVRWGLDRTDGNAAGNPPVIFGSRMRTIQTIQRRRSRLDEANVVYTLGQGIGDQRMVVIRTSGTETASNYARRAIARNATDLDTAGALQDRGDDWLYQQRIEESLDVEIQQTAGCRYGRDWDLGDLVTVEYTKLGLSVNRKIAGAIVSLGDDGKETISATLVEE